ncbi:hypothetical protein [Thiocystis violascens]|uniref:Uncharacterized protein n=1 Tax=Thiocystis violascens (strain ATCC 17096 / DSM 198 / 6111) TaxID=765911 RepID=I3YBD5_THIV6|nr:hypothetical protein [Thiocystis violascens]AFL74303.1 hypothetical protein Thivi_2357 [Thiocystis violascens DSM 198]
MQDRPAIKTAIPKRRYQVGDHGASLLGEIESGDARGYRYILALVPPGQREPVLYVCAEQTPPAERADGAYRLRVVSELMSEVVDTDDRWGDLDAFADQALKLGAQMLGLQQAPVVRQL